jgi:large subunit GTPase 1
MSRRLWADYFDEQGVQYAFFSAANAAALQEVRRQALAEAETKEAQGDSSSNSLDGLAASEEIEEEDSEEGDFESEDESESDDEGLYLLEEDDSPDSRDPRTKVLSVLELEDLFLKVAPDLSSELAMS